MVDRKLVKMLSLGPIAWNNFIREQRPGFIANLEGVRLVNAHLEYADLSGANLSGANLNGANLEGANFEEANLTKADLEEANLRLANLKFASLRGARLTKASFAAVELEYIKTFGAFENFKLGGSLRRAHLKGTDLSRADLEYADLSGANLSGANLDYANLEYANLEYADLSGANFSRANLRGANFIGAGFSFTILANVDLSLTNGLSAVAWAGFSILDNRTLALSRGQVPDDFLKGCGYADWEVAAARLYDPDISDERRIDILYRVANLHAMGPIQRNPIFISYTHVDGRFVDKLQQELDARGVRTWRDVHHAEAGPLEKVIDRAITENPTMILVLSKGSTRSPWVRWEIEKAVELERKSERPVLCPVSLDDSWRTDLPVPERKEVERYTVIDLSARGAIEKEMPRLLKGLDIHYRK